MILLYFQVTVLASDYHSSQPEGSMVEWKSGPTHAKFSDRGKQLSFFSPLFLSPFPSTSVFPSFSHWFLPFHFFLPSFFPHILFLSFILSLFFSLSFTALQCPFPFENWNRIIIVLLLLLTLNLLTQVDEVSGQEVLTCFLLPQQEYQHESLGKLHQPQLVTFYQYEILIIYMEWDGLVICVWFSLFSWFLCCFFVCLFFLFSFLFP